MEILLTWQQIQTLHSWLFQGLPPCFAFFHADNSEASEIERSSGYDYTVITWKRNLNFVKFEIADLLTLYLPKEGGHLDPPLGFSSITRQ